MVKYIILVELPSGQSQKFTTYKYERTDNRVLFTDRNGEAKDFPADKCFIEELRGGFNA